MYKYSVETMSYYTHTEDTQSERNIKKDAGHIRATSRDVSK
jgi:hypothetical protein